MNPRLLNSRLLNVRVVESKVVEFMLHSRRASSFPEGELQLEREGRTEQLNNNAASLEAALQEAGKREQEQDREALHCSRCRGDYVTAWNLDRHRWVS